MRHAVYHLFRRHPGERLRTMGFLVGEGGRGRLAGSFLGTVLYGSNELVRRGLFGPSPRESAAAMADVGKRLATLLAGTYHLKVDPEEKGFKDTRGVVVGHGFAERTTFIVLPDGKIAATVGGLSPAANVDHALDEVRRLASKK